MARERISKRTRFEVFKRDRFTCQYCGGKPPEVTLELDHIHPVAKGGTNDILNLCTSCKECNRGKGAVPLGSVRPSPGKDVLAEMAESREQLAAYQDFVLWERATREAHIDLITQIIKPVLSYENLSNSQRMSVSKFLGELGLAEVIQAAEITVERTDMLRGGGEFAYFCGICWTKIKNRNAKREAARGGYDSAVN